MHTVWEPFVTKGSGDFERGSYTMSSPAIDVTDQALGLYLENVHRNRHALNVWS